MLRYAGRSGHGAAQEQCSLEAYAFLFSSIIFGVWFAIALDNEMRLGLVMARDLRITGHVRTGRQDLQLSCTPLTFR